jgi:hypothetical protein
MYITNDATLLLRVHVPGTLLLPGTFCQSKCIKCGKSDVHVRTLHVHVRTLHVHVRTLHVHEACLLAQYFNSVYYTNIQQTVVNDVQSWIHKSYYKSCSSMVLPNLNK